MVNCSSLDPDRRNARAWVGCSRVRESRLPTVLSSEEVVELNALDAGVARLPRPSGVGEN